MTAIERSYEVTPPRVYNSVLYFPEVQVPRNDWLARVLLYWDRIGTITPRYIGQRFPYWMSNLVDAEQLEVVYPEEHLFLQVEERVAFCYMAHLARFLGERVAMQPITDHLDWLSALEFAGSREVLARRKKLRFEILSGILPSPLLPPVSTELARFKQKHRDLLQRFRRHVR